MKIHIVTHRPIRRSTVARIQSTLDSAFLKPVCKVGMLSARAVTVETEGENELRSPFIVAFATGFLAARNA